ncbi:MAG: caspase family protein [Gemmatimonadaceae bacterium]|nr:caspase family protein [Gemmatimonadaceae bacterium]
MGPSIRRLLTFLLFARALHAQSGERFALGSSAAEVARIQGRPEFVERLRSLGYEVWRYRSAWVRIGAPEDRVIAWRDPDGVLRTRGPSGWDDSTGVVVPADSIERPALRATATRPTAPVRLGVSASFRGDDGDVVLNGESGGVLTVRVRNIGPGTAFGVSARASLARAIPGVELGAASVVDSIRPGAEGRITVRVAGGAELRSDTARVDISVTEENGFDALDRAVVRFATRGVSAPRLVLADVAVRDRSGNARIEPREVVEIVARVANRGAGAARELRASLRLGEGIFLAEGAPAQFTLGTLAAGETRDVVFAAYANARTTAFDVRLVLREARARFDTVIVLPLALDRPMPRDREWVAPENEAPRRGGGAPAPLVSDIDTPAPRGAPRENDVVAVVFGVERYERSSPVPFARRDAANFRDLLTRSFRVPDDAAHLYARTDDEVTAAEFEKVFARGGWLDRRVQPSTDVIIYFAGHGTADPRTQLPFLLANDADPSYPAQTGVALRELYDRLGDLRARSITLFLDACFTGAGREGAPLVSGARSIVVSVEHPALRNPRLAVFAAGQGNEYALPYPEQRHGLFSYWLIKGLRGAADRDQDRAVAVGELARYVQENVRATSLKLDRLQTPETTTRDSTRVLVRFP